MSEEGTFTVDNKPHMTGGEQSDWTIIMEAVAERYSGAEFIPIASAITRIRAHQNDTAARLRECEADLEEADASRARLQKVYLGEIETLLARATAAEQERDGLRLEVECWKETAANRYSEIERTQIQRDGLLAALMFYANNENRKYSKIDKGGNVTSNIEIDFGDVARSAIALCGSERG